MSWPSSSGLRGRRKTYLTILEWADHALFKKVRYVLLRPLRPELDGQDVEVLIVLFKSLIVLRNGPHDHSPEAGQLPFQ
jgi:hypothetical protein